MLFPEVFCVILPFESVVRKFLRVSCFRKYFFASDAVGILKVFFIESENILNYKDDSCIRSFS